MMSTILKFQAYGMDFDTVLSNGKTVWSVVLSEVFLPIFSQNYTFAINSFDIFGFFYDRARDRSVSIVYSGVDKMGIGNVITAFELMMKKRYIKVNHLMMHVPIQARLINQAWFYTLNLTLGQAIKNRHFSIPAGVIPV